MADWAVSFEPGFAGLRSTWARSSILQGVTRRSVLPGLRPARLQRVRSTQAVATVFSDQHAGHLRRPAVSQARLRLAFDDGPFGSGILACGEQLAVQATGTSSPAAPETKA